eukprot:m.142949 g.142949  ORF g.142949 m.142949 type:complete len:1353 (-) comp14075_c0_seq2:455-4513(-)
MDDCMPMAEFRHSSKSSGVVCIKYDPFHCLLWVVSRDGYVSSYHCPGYTRFTAWRCGKVKEIVPLPNGLCIFTDTAMQLHDKGGPKTATFARGPLRTVISANCATTHPSVFCGTEDGNLLRFNLQTNAINSTIELKDGRVSHVQIGSAVVCATDRKVHVINQRRMVVVQSFDLLPGQGVRSLDVHEELVLFIPETHDTPYIVVHHMESGAQLSRFNTTGLGHVLSAHIAMNANTNQAQSCVVMRSGAMYNIPFKGRSRQGETYIQTQSVLSSSAVSPTNQVLAVGDELGHVFVMSLMAGAMENPFGAAVDDSNDLQFYHQYIDVDDWSKSLGFMLVPLPTVSNWRGDTDMFLRAVPKVPKAIDANLTVHGGIGYCRNTMEWKLNAAPYPPNMLQRAQQHDLKGGRNQRQRRDRYHADYTPMDRKVEDELTKMIPKSYRKCDIKYSHFGIDQFDFGHYNVTPFPGLETDIPNSYCNAMLQIYNFLSPLRTFCITHVCEEETCLTCELGFLFDMMSGTNTTCQATNFLRAFRINPATKRLNLLVEDEKVHRDLHALILEWNSFTLGALDSSLKEPLTNPTSNTPTTFNSLFGADMASTITCRSCKTASTTTSTFPQLPLHSPAAWDSLMTTGLGAARHNPEEIDYEDMKFSDVMAKSMVQFQSLSAQCSKCKGIRPSHLTKKVTKLPDILMLSCRMDKAEDKVMWRRKQPKHTAPPPKLQLDGEDDSDSDVAASWIPISIDVDISNISADQIVVTEQLHMLGDTYEPAPLPHSRPSTAASQDSMADEAGAKQYRGVHKAYELVAALYHVKATGSNGNLVSVIKIPSNYARHRGIFQENRWFLFNDFSVADATVLDAVTYNTAWKTPAILVYAVPGTEQKFYDQALPPIAAFKQRYMLDRTLSRMTKTPYIPLKEDQLPKKGDLVAIDAEFVQLKKEDAELRSTGHKAMIRPEFMALARVSLVGGSGDLHGVTLVDDYIKEVEKVEDYVTRYSGIKQADLDPNRSQHHLTTLKIACSKLQFFLSLGVKFVGHGLNKDFRVLNITPPPEQVIDTVNLFYLVGQRKLSLRFLAWYLLNISVQTDSAFGHDSVEDSVTALKLYEYYLTIHEDDSKFHSVMQDLYSFGQTVRFQVPEDGSISPYYQALHPDAKPVIRKAPPQPKPSAKATMAAAKAPVITPVMTPIMTSAPTVPMKAVAPTRPVVETSNISSTQGGATFASDAAVLMSFPPTSATVTSIPPVSEPPSASHAPSSQVRYASEAAPLMTVDTSALLANASTPTSTSTYPSRTTITSTAGLPTTTTATTTSGRGRGQRLQSRGRGRGRGRGGSHNVRRGGIHHGRGGRGGRGRGRGGANTAQ